MTKISQIIRRSPSTPNEGVEQVINDWCNIIADEISERRFFDKGEVAAYAKIKLSKAIDECLKLQRDDLVKKRMKLVEEYTNPNTSYSRKVNIANEIAALNIRIKERNNVGSGIRDFTIKKGEEFKNIDKQNELKIDGNRYLTGKVTSISETAFYSLKPVRRFVLCLGFNTKNPGHNESNYVEVTLKNDNCKLIDSFHVGEIVVIQYTISGNSFNGTNGLVFAHAIICSNIFPTT